MGIAQYVAAVNELNAKRQAKAGRRRMREQRMSAFLAPLVKPTTDYLIDRHYGIKLDAATLAVIAAQNEADQASYEADLAVWEANEAITELERDLFAEEYGLPSGLEDSYA